MNQQIAAFPPDPPTQTRTRLAAVSRMLALCLGCSPMIFAGTYYVATNGSDSNLGTITSPFATVNKAVSSAVGGDTVYVRGGTYRQTVTISRSGSSGSQLVVSGYPSETAVFDGNNSIPAVDTPMMLISGNYVTVQDMTVQNTNGIGLQMQGNYGQALRIKSYRNWSTGIRVTSGAYNLVQNCEVYWNDRNNDRTVGNIPQYWGAGLSVNGNGVNHTTVTGNKVWNNWGEGLSTFSSTYTTVQDNIVWDNWANNIYISDTSYDLVQRNLAYHTSTSAVAGYGGALTNIEVGDETTFASSNNTIINNFAMGGSRVFACCTGATNNVIANNTFVNASASGGITTVQIYSSGTYTNAKFINNIIEQDDGLPIGNIASGTGLQMSDNVWSKTPPSAGSGAGDVVGNPQLAKTGSTAPGAMVPDWFKLNATSPAIHKAASLSQVTEDFFHNARGSTPDSGGDQYVTSTGTDSTAPSVPTGLTAKAVSSSEIDLSWTAATDTVGVTGYRIYRGGTQIATVTGTSYQNTGLTASTGYAYTVAAYDAAGNVSPQSASVSATTLAAADTTAPSAPTGLTASAVSASQINLSWTASTDNVGVSGYRISRNGAQIATVAGTSYSNSGLSASTTYSYTVVAYDAAGNVSTAASASATTPAAADTSAPTAPASMTATAVSSSQINLSWTASTDNVAVVGYRLYRNGVQIATQAGTSYADTGLTASTTYTYSVVAYDAAGNTSSAASASATTAAATSLSVRITYPASGTSVPRYSTVVLQGQATSSAAITSAQWIVDGVAVQSAALTATASSTVSQAYWNTGNGRGWHSISLTITDAAGGTATTNVRVKTQ